MSYIFKGIFGAVAVALTLGAAQFASGEDLTVRHTNGRRPVDQASTAAARPTARRFLAEPVAPTQTICTSMSSGFPDTRSWCVSRARREAHRRANAQLARRQSKSGGAASRQVACEPVVSVLTEIAKRLQPGRCVT